MATKTSNAESTAQSNGAAPEKPVYDFSRVSRKWMREMGRIARESAELIAAMGDGTEPEGVDDETLADWRAARIEAAVKQDELTAEQERLIAVVLVSVPHDWLLPDAPAEIDWSDPESIVEYLHFQRADQLGTDVYEQLGEYRKN